LEWFKDIDWAPLVGKAREDMKIRVLAEITLVLKALPEDVLESFVEIALPTVLKF